MMSAAADFDRTRAHQRDASDPRVSAWVIANAGSGKTHVLTQRVIRLMLAGADPASILCLTFTRVAAAEMSRRVFATLGEWTTLDELELAVALEALQGSAPTEAEIRQARRLFAKALETPGGLKIQTLHAFCERLLHEFPFEANVPGQFSVLDDSAAAALIAAAREEMLNRAAAEPLSRLGRAVRHMAERANDEQFGKALDALIANRDALRRWIEKSAPEGEAGSIEDALIDLRRRLGLNADENEASICQKICGALHFGREHCSSLVAALQASANGTDRNAHAAIAAILAATDEVEEADQRIGFFLSLEDGAFKCRSAPHRFGAAFRKGNAGIEEKFAQEASRVLALAERLGAARAYDATEALLIAGDAILQSYQLAKRRAGGLDFSDLIAKARNLLSRSDAADWVLYKLDRRIEHILVDEAQDTSADQWRVVKAIAADFFSGEGAARAPRTIFAVGDDKQSIFRFQGAEPRLLVEMQHFFDAKIAAAGEHFVARPLYLSFRSTREVLYAVDTVFGGELAAAITASSYTPHAARRDEHPGHLVLLPREVRKKAEEPEDWTAPFDAPSAAETDLAERIAKEIGRIRNTVLPSGKRLRDGEILVLVRKRDAFAAAMNRALRKRLIPAAGADRIPVSTHISVLDLLALADVMLLPEDDLQLAALLKSPLLGFTEAELMQLAMVRERTLWRTLQDQGDNLFARTAAEKLRRWRATADKVTPFQFFATVLGPEGGRRAFRARLGGEADDVLDTFLSQALAYEAVEPPSLQGFARFIRANESDIKREAEEGASGVRVMTVHGAKGLEADVVFLVDTGGAAVVPGQRDILVDIGADRDDPAFLWRRRKQEAPSVQNSADAAADAEEQREYLRLLYVAMTRARDVLYVAGVKLLRPPESSWYTIVRDALLPEDRSGIGFDEDGELKEPFVWPPSLRPPRGADAERPTKDAAHAPAPDWLARAAPTPPRAPQPLRPSNALAEPDPLPAGWRVPDPEALQRGRAVHLLLQYLPFVAPEQRAAAADRLLAGEFAQSPDLAAALCDEVMAVLAHPALAGLFISEARSEVAIVGSVATTRGEYVVSGRIDWLLRDSTGWRLVDFKTDRRVPTSVSEVDPGYVLQLALYRKLLMEMQPGVPVSAALVYTAGPNVVPVPEESLEKALETLGVRANTVS